MQKKGISTDTRSVQENFNLITSFIQDSADKHIPSKTSRSVSSVPWVTPAIRRKIRRKNATNAKAKKSGSANIRAKFETLILGTLSKYHSSIRVSISSIYLAYLEIILLNHLFLIILKIGNHLLFVINIINLLEVQYSISINWLLILILILRLQIHEIVRIQNYVMNLQAILLQEI